ncbi:MAG: tail fiber domain-containing protein [Saprospiraceae bacterium]|nr:tail fiber domain-containing protein [Saprospiraceae bacterium]
MKYLYTTLLALLCSAALLAQTTPGINYQAVLRDNSFQAIANQSGTATISILNSDNTELYREIHTVQTNPLGLFNVVVGTGTTLSGNFPTLDWGSGGRSMQVTVAVGANNYVFPATALQAVPYAKVAERALLGDDDSDPDNEIQFLSISGNQINLSGGGGTVMLPTATDNQQLSLNGPQLTISNGNTVTLPTGTTYTAGPGIGIAGNQISNTGDLNANDDLTINSTFGGDVTGTAGNLQLAPGSVGTAEIADGSISTADLQPGAVQPSSIAQNGASTGQVLQWNGTAWVPATPAAGTDNQQLSLSGNQLSISNGNTVTLPAEADGSTTNELQTLTLSGNQLSLSNGGGNVQLPTPPVYVGGQGISINGANVVTNTGDTNPADDITNATPAAGALTGFYPAPQLAPGAINSSSIADGSIVLADLAPGIVPQSLNDLSDVVTTGATTGQTLKWNGAQWTPQDDNTTSGSGSTTTAAPLIGNGSAGSPVTIGQNGASTGQTLKWNGSTWAPANDNGASYTAGAGIQISGDVISATDNSTTNEIQSLSLSGNQLSISNGNTVLLPQDNDASATNEIQTLSLSGDQLTLTPGGGSVTLPSTPTYSAGTGISIVGNVITNTGDTNAANDLTTTSVADGDITGVFSNLTIKASRVGTTQLSNNSVTAEKLTNLGATTAGQVLKWNGSAWAAGTDLQGSGGGSLTLPYSGICSTTGPEGIGFRIANTADQSAMYILNTYPNSFNSHAAIVGENIGNTTLPSGAEFAAPAYGVQGIANAAGQDGTGVQGIGSVTGVSGISNTGVGGVFTGARSLIATAGVGFNTFAPERTVHIKQSSYGGVGDSGLKLENEAGNFDVEMAVFNGRLEFYFNDAAAIAAIQPNGQYVNLSDRRLKKDIQRFEASVLGRVNSLPMYTYRYKQENDNAALSFGVLAQELQERFPELVSEGKNRPDGQSYLGVAYDKLGLVAIKAIQEQQQIIEQQQAELAQMKKDLSELQEQMAQLKQLVADLKGRQ